MSSPLEQRPFLLRLFDAFLQEENIKWVLGLGVCLLLGSSLRLVTLHWVEYTPIWKYLILLGYTACVFGFGEFTYHRMGLRKTGTVLMSLTVLLIPITFLALHWIQPDGAQSFDILIRNAGLASLVGLNLAWSAFASQRVFRHFLRGTQPTFTVCYLILCAAGAIVPGLPAAWSLPVSIVLWAVFAAGSIKVNRHIFWLTEEHRLPRIIGFFPVLLLGSQFAAVFSLGIVGNVSTPWIGLLAALVSLPILMTADAVARVFEQRTGGLVRPFPWSISAPLAIGTLLAFAGVVMAVAGWPASPAIVPTAVIAAVAMGLVAHRTQKSFFVWLMLLGVVIAYQTCPVFFKEWVLQLRDQAAAAVREPKLPYAYYGLTYAPLIVVFSVASAWIRRRTSAELFARPLQIVATGLPLLLLGAAFTHPSAVLPVSLVLCPLFAIQSSMFRNRWYAIPACLAFLSAAYGIPEFFLRVLQWSLEPEAALFVWTTAAATLLAPAVLLRRSNTREVTFETLSKREICQAFSLLAVLAAALVWLSKFGTAATMMEFGMAAYVGLFIVAIIAGQALKWSLTPLGAVTLLFASWMAYLRLSSVELASHSSFDVVCWLMLGQWLLSYALARVRRSRVGLVFEPATRVVSTCGLTVLFAIFAIHCVGQHIGQSWLPASSGLILLWSLDAARRFGHKALAAASWGTVFLYVTGTMSIHFGPAASHGWMLAWVLTGVALCAVRACLVRIIHSRSLEGEQPAGAQQRLRNWIAPLALILPILFASVALASLIFLGWPQRLAGVLALACAVLLRSDRRIADISGAFLPLLNWHLIAATVALATGASGTIFELTTFDIAAVAFPIAPLAAFSLWSFESRRLSGAVAPKELVAVHRILLAMLSALLLGITLALQTEPWSELNIALGAITWIAVIGTLLGTAVRTQDADWGWWTLTALAAAVLYFSAGRAIDLTSASVPYLALLSGIAINSVGHRAQGTWKVLSVPFRTAGFWLPLAVLPVALFRQMGDANVLWAGANSLPLLGAATFYFWRGMEQRRLGISLLSFVLLNLAFVLLWNDLNWHDPQLFLMPIGISIVALTELMNREIPSNYHNRLRLTGSLLILVSPTFHIVDGSWLHILTLMLASVLVALAAIGLRVRMLLYTSTAFLLADLVALVVRGSREEPNVLWITGVVLGGLIIALGAVCENHRELVLARLRGLAAELQGWA